MPLGCLRASGNEILKSTNNVANSVVSAVTDRPAWTERGPKMDRPNLGSSTESGSDDADRRGQTWTDVGHTSVDLVLAPGDLF